MSPYDQVVLNAIVEARENGQSPSLFGLHANLGCDYKTAWRAVTRLEQGGRLSVIRRGPGRPLTLIPLEEP